MFDLGRLDEVPRTVSARQRPAEARALVSEITALEEAVTALRARQAALVADLADLRDAESAPRRESERDDEIARMRQVRVSVGAEVALARRIAPSQGRAFVSLARMLARELPHTRAAFEAGLLSERRAALVARHTACLSREHRARVDAEIAGDQQRLARQGDRELESRLRARAAELDAEAVVTQRRRAEGERRVSVRPATDSMAYVTAVLPIKEAVRVYAALRRIAVDAVGRGEATAEGPAMADALVERVTGAPLGSPVPLQLRLAMPLGTLLGFGPDATAVLGDEIGLLRFDGIPAGLARGWVSEALSSDVQVTMKRLLAAPDTGELVALESRSRHFPRGLAELIRLRDGWCRTPWCGAPIRQLDHVRRHADGGPTSAANGQGLCVSCNLAKEAAGWRHTVEPGPGHRVVVTTPTGHRHPARPPVALSPPRPARHPDRCRG